MKLWDTLELKVWVHDPEARGLDFEDAVEEAWDAAAKAASDRLHEFFPDVMVERIIGEVSE